MSKSQAAGRMFQDINFKVKSAAGKKLEQLICVENPDNPDGGPVLVYIKMEGISWSQYFLESCFGVWENWGEIETDDDAYSYHDYAEKFGVKGLIITAVYCKDNEISLEFETSEKLVLKYKDPDEWDGDTEMIKILTP
ncbi:hypothetical protein [Fluviicola sp.]|uniref:hypothetical protein n=1 Tax=Fluviicola sp. TaxID=1917219 RepID=UPI002635FC97|nr:hypothetical protein [Fluviicola sp.]